MKKCFLLLFFIFALTFDLNAQDNLNREQEISVLPATQIGVQQDIQVNPTLTNYRSRFFGKGLFGSTTAVVKSFLNTPATLVNVGGAQARNLFGGAIAGTGIYYGLEYLAAGSGNLVTVDTTTGVIVTIGPLTGLAAGHTLTGMAWDRTASLMYVVSTNGAVGTLYTVNLINGTLTTVAPSMAGTALPIDIAINNAGIMYSCDIGTDVLNTIDKTTGAATLVGSLGVNLNFAQGMAIDPETDSLFLAGFLATQTSHLYRCNTSTGATTLIGNLGATPTEVDAFVIPGASPPVTADTVLILMHDSVSTVDSRRKADRDTMNRYLPSLITRYVIKSVDSNTTLPNLSNYKTIILQETSFDNILVRYLGATARGQLKTWLQAGTPIDKRSLILIGADLAYNYSRTGSGGRDIEFAETYSKYIYRVDNAPGSTLPAIIGVAIDVGNSRSLTSAPPGGGYYPDGCSIVTGGLDLYRYQNHTALDTVGAIGNIQPGYLVASLFSDPRYFVSDFRTVFTQVVGWVKNNGGVITGINNVSTITPNDYDLHQNYPNPFNPVTNIKFSIEKEGLVNIKVFDVLGRVVTTLVNEKLRPGSYNYSFNASNLSSGTYFYRMEVNGFVQTKKMQVIK